MAYNYFEDFIAEPLTQRSTILKICYCVLLSCFVRGHDKFRHVSFFCRPLNLCFFRRFPTVNDVLLGGVFMMASSIARNAHFRRVARKRFYRMAVLQVEATSRGIKVSRQQSQTESTIKICFFCRKSTKTIHVMEWSGCRRNQLRILLTTSIWNWCRYGYFFTLLLTLGKPGRPSSRVESNRGNSPYILMQPRMSLLGIQAYSKRWYHLLTFRPTDFSDAEPALRKHEVVAAVLPWTCRRSTTRCHSFPSK